MRVTSTLLSEPQLREAEAMFARLRDKPRPLTFYLDYALANHTEPNLRQPIADAISDYLTERARGRGPRAHLSAAAWLHSH